MGPGQHLTPLSAIEMACGAFLFSAGAWKGACHERSSEAKEVAVRPRAVVLSASLGLTIPESLLNRADELIQ